ncbi:MAG: hypothetical protein K8R25_02940 [Methanosarcinales archaeon]|nr:hypothetical protein [Methanosarcinales archaeon]
MIYLLDLDGQAGLYYIWSPIGVTVGQGDIQHGQEANGRGVVRLAALCLATDLQRW